MMQFSLAEQHSHLMSLFFTIDCAVFKRFYTLVKVEGKENEYLEENVSTAHERINSNDNLSEVTKKSSLT